MALGNKELSIEQQKLLDLHLELVIQENKRTNLTRITDPKSARVLHIEDSLVGLEELNSAPQGLYLDMGTGAGYPGIPLAIVTQRKTVLADSVSKKISALNRIIQQLGLTGYVETYQGRLEELAVSRPGCFSAITARALSNLSSLLELAAPLLGVGGYLIAYKSSDIEDELKHAQDVSYLFGLHFVLRRDVVLSDGNTRRSIIVFQKKSEPEIQLPRRVGMAQKKPF